MPKTLKRYLPKQTMLAGIYKKLSGEKDGLSERDILYKVLFDMKKDFNDLKKLVLETVPNQAKVAQLVKDHPELFDGIETEQNGVSSEHVVLNLPSISNQRNKHGRRP